MPTDLPEFSLTIDQNPYLPVGGEQMHAVITVTAGGAATLATASTEIAEVIIVDRSASMSGGKLAEARRAACTAVETLRDGVHFAVLAGGDSTSQVYPTEQALAIAGSATRETAVAAIKRIRASGGTAIGNWLRAAADLSTTRPQAVRHAILLTDGRNGQSRRQFDADLAYCAGKFTCDSLGVGDKWDPAELARVAQALLGTRDYVRDAGDLASYFASLTSQAMARTVAEMTLRVRAPQLASVRFLKQVHPTMLELTGQPAGDGSPALDYRTGAWGAEEREYQLCVDFPSGAAGERARAAAVSLVLPDGTELARGSVFIAWTDDLREATRVNSKVAHYTGALALADQVQQGLGALDAGDRDTATARLADARRIAEQAGNDETLRLIDRLVEVDTATGTAKLRRQIHRGDRLALDVGTDRTAKARPGQES